MQKLSKENLSDKTPDWIDIDKLIKMLKREWVLGFARKDGDQGKIRTDKLSIIDIRNYLEK